jgi:SAM-dependent methyltransferase
VPVKATADVMQEVLKNMAMGMPLVRRGRLTRPRAGVRFTGQDTQLHRYAFQSLNALRPLIGELRGQSICEIGPGDFLTSGMAMLAAGAASYLAIDRFIGDYSCLAGREWYAAIQESWPRIYPELPWPGWLNSGRFPKGYPERVMTCGASVESAAGIGTFDIVCSFQVGEHVSDVAEFAYSTARLLRPGGVAVHRIDFGPHGAWRAYKDPLTFLRVPEPIWRAMGSARGTPNRRRVHELENAFRAAGLAVRLSGIERYPASKTDLGRLPARFREMPVESVLTETAVLVATHAASYDRL